MNPAKIDRVLDELAAAVLPPDGSLAVYGAVRAAIASAALGATLQRLAELAWLGEHRGELLELLHSRRTDGAPDYSCRAAAFISLLDVAGSLDRIAGEGGLDDRSPRR